MVPNWGEKRISRSTDFDMNIGAKVIFFGDFLFPWRNFSFRFEIISACVSRNIERFRIRFFRAYRMRFLLKFGVIFEFDFIEVVF